MSEHANTPSESGNDTAEAETENYRGLAENIENAQDRLDDFEADLPPFYREEVNHLGTDLEVLGDWVDDAEEEGANALAGAATVVATMRARMKYFEDELGQQGDLQGKLQSLEGALNPIEEKVEDLSITETAYVVYVNREYVARYWDSNVAVETVLEDAGRQKPSELGLFPLDGLYGDWQTDQAFPADNDLDLDGDHRTYFESTSDGGKIA